MNVAELITFREVVGQEPTLDLLHSILKKYQRLEVIFLLAKLNCMLGTWQNAPRFDLDIQFSNYLLRAFDAELQRLRQVKPYKVAFSRLSILFLLKQAAFACPPTGALLKTRSAHSDMGVCVLLANDLLFPFPPSKTDNTTIKRISNLLPFADYISHGNYPMEIGRSQIIFDDIASLPALRRQSDFLDMETLFHESVGLDHRLFCQFILATSSKFLNLKAEDLERNHELAVVRKDYLFRKSPIPGEQIATFFPSVACSEDRFMTEILKMKERPANDLTIFQAFPLIEIIKDVHACLDPGFLVDKAGRSLYWTLFFAVPPDKRGTLASFWGTLVEKYVNHILKESYKAGGIFIPEPRFDDGPAFDACLLEGRDLLVFEHKSSVIRADAKYGADHEKLKAELDLKFIEGEEDEKKGIAQLSNCIDRFLRGETVSGINVKDVDRIYPIMVCLESTMVAPFLGTYINERFDAIFPRRDFKQAVAPVFTLGLVDIENLLGYLQEFRFSDILESYHRENKLMLVHLSGAEVPILRNANAGNNIVRDRFSIFSDQMLHTFFPDGPPE